MALIAEIYHDIMSCRKFTTKKSLFVEPNCPGKQHKFTTTNRLKQHKFNKLNCMLRDKLLHNFIMTMCQAKYGFSLAFTRRIFSNFGACSRFITHKYFKTKTKNLFNNVMIYRKRATVVIQFFFKKGAHRPFL